MNSIATAIPTVFPIGEQGVGVSIYGVRWRVWEGSGGGMSG